MLTITVALFLNPPETYEFMAIDKKFSLLSPTLLSISSILGIMVGALGTALLLKQKYELLCVVSSNFQDITQNELNITS